MDKKFNLVDESTPIGEFLSAHYKRCNHYLWIRMENVELSLSFRSFAHFTIKERLPVILTRILDGLSRAKEQLVAERGEVISLGWALVALRLLIPLRTGSYTLYRNVAMT